MTRARAREKGEGHMKTPTNGYDIPKQKVPAYRRVMGGRSPKAAIRLFCSMCVGWERGAVEECTAPDCPLFPYRQSVRKASGKQAKDGRSPGGAGCGADVPSIARLLQDKGAFDPPVATCALAPVSLSERSADHEGQDPD